MPWMIGSKRWQDGVKSVFCRSEKTINFLAKDELFGGINGLAQIWILNSFIFQ